MTRGTHPASLANLRSGGRPGRRSPRMNLYRDGFEGCAGQVSARVRRSGEPLQVHVAPDGGVYCSPGRKIANAPMLELIGTYNNKARVEHIEDDLLAWIREQNTQRAACA